MDSIALLQGSQQKWHLSSPGVKEARKTGVGSGGDGRGAKLGLVLESRPHQGSCSSPFLISSLLGGQAMCVLGRAGREDR